MRARVFYIPNNEIRLYFAKYDAYYKLYLTILKSAIYCCKKYNIIALSLPKVQLYTVIQTQLYKCIISSINELYLYIFFYSRITFQDILCEK